MVHRKGRYFFIICIALLLFKLPPLTQVNYDDYMNLGWQVTTGTEEEQKQANFVTVFMDIYEDCVQAIK